LPADGLSAAFRTAGISASPHCSFFGLQGYLKLAATRKRFAGAQGADARRFADPVGQGREELPKTSNGKIMKQSLKQRLMREPSLLSW
jgi:hypothetical protein